jgi:hypothetical protein
MMTIIVEGNEFQMHRGLLFFHSTYFRKLLDGPFREGGSNRHTLTDVTLDTFTMFYNWAYTGSIIDSYEIADSYLESADIINIYAFADFHMINQLENRAIDLFFIRMARTWGVDVCDTSMLYDRTTSHYPLRKLHVDILLGPTRSQIGCLK